MFSAIGRASFYRLFQLLFQRLELFRLRVFFIKRVERVTARYQAVARPGGAIAERAAQPLGSESGAVDHVQRQVVVGQDHPPQDRKSTRLNSSHGSISYAVFCLKKKKN